MASLLPPGLEEENRIDQRHTDPYDSLTIP